MLLTPRPITINGRSFFCTNRPDLKLRVYILTHVHQPTRLTLYACAHPSLKYSLNFRYIFDPWTCENCEDPGASRDLPESHVAPTFKNDGFHKEVKKNTKIYSNYNIHSNFFLWSPADQEEACMISQLSVLEMVFMWRESNTEKNVPVAT